MTPTFNYIARQREEIARAKENRLAHQMAMGDFMSTPSPRAAMVKRAPRGVLGRGPDVRDMLMKVGGIGSFNAELAIPQMFLMPRTTDPDNASTICIIEGLQRALNKIGAGVEVNGLLTPETVQTLRRASGASWMSKTWVQIYGDVAQMINRRVSLRPSGTALGELVAVGDAFTAVPVATLLGGVALLILALK
jgi:hypothetical protein